MIRQLRDRLRPVRGGLFLCLLLLVPCQASERYKAQFKSSADGTMQPTFVILPDGYNKNKPAPLLVSLHTWSGGMEQRHKEFESEANRRGWIYLFPHFRGANKHPDACGSVKAQQDILDAIAWAKKNLSVDSKRVYLTGVSGGGHMTMMMAARYPKQFTAASAWVGISDMGAWYERHKGDRYGQMMRASCGGALGESKAIDREYRQRSPLTFLAKATTIPLDIAAGIHDGHTGSVPISHSLEAFNVIAKSAGDDTISVEEMKQLSTPKGRLKKPQKSDQVVDGSYGRAIYLRRHAALSRVTIFEGGHEGIAKAAFVWLEKFPRSTATRAPKSR